MRLPHRRVLVLGLVAATTLTASSAPGRGRNTRDALATATNAVVGDRSEKVRVQAALVLGRTRDPRATPFLMKALADTSATVRAMAAKALGDIGDETARPGLEVAAADPSPLVRRHALLALTALTERSAQAAIAIKPMGDQTHSASNELRERMRGFVAIELRHIKKRAPGTYTVDGAIKALSISGRSDVVEVRCGVELVLSTGRNAIVMMSSGEAIVQRQKQQFRPAMQPSMELEALQHAVKGAAEELRDHFAANSTPLAP
ncbi:MAG: HEAT repeat domain-containing protein [Bacteroidota bacterium]